MSTFILGRRILAPFLGGLIASLVMLLHVAPGRESLEAAPFTALQEQELPKPGAEHDWLKGRAGSWTVATRMRMSADAPWMENQGTETATMACGGFWQISVQKGSFMGMPFEGRMQLGYDQIKKKFVGTWIDNYGSWLSIMEGTLSADRKVLTLFSDMFDPQSGKTVRARMETTMDGKDKASFKMFMPGADGKEFLTMQQSLTRRK